MRGRVSHARACAAVACSSPPVLALNLAPSAGKVKGQSEGIPVLGLLQHGAGRLAVYGDRCGPGKVAHAEEAAHQSRISRPA